jgi:hypothetical protein
MRNGVILKGGMETGEFSKYGVEVIRLVCLCCGVACD